jgi:hypothetical protein
VLTPLDDTLRHVLPTTFDHAGTSDPRFFDRYWFAVYDPAGTEPVLNTGMCTYLNMNVADGYASMIAAGKQHNLRLSAALRPQLFDAPAEVTTVGPLRMEVLEPFRRLRLQLDRGESDMAFDLEWSATLPPHEELHNFTRVRGRVTQDYRRYNQSGRVDGWIELGGSRTDVRDWWGGRDHSWGVRTDVAGGEPVTGPDEPRNGRTGFLWTWLTFGADDFGGHVQLQELPDGSAIHSEGMIRWADGTQITSGDVSRSSTCCPAPAGSPRPPGRSTAPPGPVRATGASRSARSAGRWPCSASATRWATPTVAASASGAATTTASTTSTTSPTTRTSCCPTARSSVPTTATARCSSRSPRPMAR